MTAFLALWGALLSSLMAGFEVFRFISRARLRSMVQDGFLILTPGQRNDGVLHLSFTVKNIGSQATTLESVGVYGFTRMPWKWRRPFRRFERTKAAVLTVEPIPFVLQPGHKWSAHLPQQLVQEAFAVCDRVSFVINHSMARTEILLPHVFRHKQGDDD
ncbi:hypothetical protein O0I63_12160 [Stenotrophomonas sp. Sm8]|uniref:hypothetical protein n=1 Tax=Stenotrophomonas sp. Sm8 TaxID=3002753 RepID=UPI000DE6CE64|nr:hypothetical protein [Stenotrophomonas sp. Sm8]MBN4945172.1 hypothetical protein [Stenotrophomonas maltophilia]MDQ7316080.1 hypothetical protein [Stenotrophomonas sp. Sm8]SSM89987.1 Uncharacterised protein [Acinetobacter baumannii]HDS1547163.1 hypothetical protein [Stenotrophomonas maltophilia]